MVALGCAHTPTNASTPPLWRWRTSDLPDPEPRRQISTGYVWEVFLSEGRVDARRKLDNRDFGTDESAELPFAIVQGRAEEGTAGKVYAKRVVDGWIIGFNAGEFGAGLWWYSPDGSKRVWISHDQIGGFFELAGALYALDGAGSMLPIGGFIQLIQDGSGQWRSVRMAALDDVPKAVTLDADGSFIAITRNRVIRIGPDKQIVDLVETSRLGFSLPNSVAVSDDESIYVGMHGGVMRLSKSGVNYKAKWLTPRK